MVAGGGPATISSTHVQAAGTATFFETPEAYLAWAIEQDRSIELCDGQQAAAPWCSTRPAAPSSPRTLSAYSVFWNQMREWPGGIPSSRPASTQPLRTQNCGPWKLKVSV